MKAGKSLFVFIASIVIIPFAAQNYIAEEVCDHQWERYDSSYEYVDETQHKIIETFYCSNCNEYKSTETLEDHAWKHEKSWNYNDLSETQHSYSESFSCSTCGGYKTETAKSAHKWVLSSKYHSDVKSISSGQHSYTSCYYCDNCHRYKYPSSKEKHKFDKYGICQICEYYKTGTITLKSNSTVSVNKDMWMKVTAPQKGLLYLYVRNTKYPWIELYNSKKWKFPGDYYSTEGNGKVIIPVSKGTYYLKLSYPMYDTIKYVFKADPSKKNYTQNKAISAKQNKTYTTVIYSGDKKNTWNRYYKLKLTKKQRITLLPTYGNVGSLFNSKGEYISTSSYYDKNGNWAGYTTERKLPKGTYYLKIYASWNSVTRKQTTGRYYSFKWK